jgi:hypothetical protein
VLPYYWLAPDAGAAIALDAGAAIAPDAGAALVSDAGAGAGAAAGADAEVSLAALGAAAGAVWSLLLLQAANAKAAIREAMRRDFFMITSFYR